MKIIKLLNVLVLSFLTSSLFATQTAKAFITITSQNGFDDIVKLYEDDAVTNYAQCQFDSYNTMGNPVNMWIEANSTTYEKVKLASLSNLVMKFKANSETSFTMTFSSVEGNAIVLKRSDVDTIITADASKSYAFTCTASQEITFTVNPKVPGYERKNLTISNWGTLCLPYASSKVEGATIYTVAGKDKATDPTGVYLLPYTSNLVAGTPYVFQATATELKVTYTGDSVVAGNANGLIGSYTEENIAAGMYIIVDNQLKQTADATCSVRANGAYFDFSQMSVYTPTPSSPARFMSIRGAATGLEAAEAPAMMEGKMIINGKLVIIRDGKMFNAQGAQL